MATLFQIQFCYNGQRVAHGLWASLEYIKKSKYIFVFLTVPLFTKAALKEDLENR